MANDDKPRSLAVIVGERLRLFREERGLRQSDIATAAAACGLTWGRSSIAALEAGTRNLSVEEVLFLPYVISNAGGWDKPIVPPETKILISRTNHAKGADLEVLIQGLTRPVREFSESRLIDPNEFEEMELGVPLKTRLAGTLSLLQDQATDAAWYRFCRVVYPQIDELSTTKSLFAEMEMNIKVADRVDMPGGMPSDARAVNIIAHGLWGRSVAAERDARVPEENYPSRRSLQSARGHATRELINQIQEEMFRRYGQMQAVFGPLRDIWEDEHKLREWLTKANADRWDTAEPVEPAPVLVPEEPWNTIVARALVDARTASGTSLADVSRATDISVRALEAMEQGDFSRYDEPILAGIYVSEVADAVGADSVELRRLVEEGMEAKRRDDSASGPKPPKIRRRSRRDDTPTARAERENAARDRRYDSGGGPKN